MILWTFWFLWGGFEWKCLCCVCSVLNSENMTLVYKFPCFVSQNWRTSRPASGHRPRCIPVLGPMALKPPSSHTLWTFVPALQSCGIMVWERDKKITTKINTQRVLAGCCMCYASHIHNPNSSSWQLGWTPLLSHFCRWERWDPEDLVRCTSSGRRRCWHSVLVPVGQLFSISQDLKALLTSWFHSFPFLSLDFPKRSHLYYNKTLGHIYKPLGPPMIGVSLLFMNSLTHTWVMFIMWLMVALK